MTAVVQPTKASGMVFTPTALLPLLLGLLLMVGQQVLPFVNQPGLGATPARTLLARGNNELGLPLDGLSVITYAGAAAAALGLWAILDVRVSRVVAVLAALCGVVALVYYVNFFRSAGGRAALDALGLAFWTGLVGAGALVAQVAWPRPAVPERYQVRRVLGNQEFILVVALLLLMVITGLVNPRFLADRNLSDLLQGHAYVAVAAIGMTMVILTGNIDISVGSLVGVLAVVSGRMAVAGYPVWSSWLAPLLLGALVGLVIGVLVAYVRIPSIVVTLGMLSILKGGLIIATNGERVINMPSEFFLAQQRFLGVTMPVWFMLVLTLLAAVWLRYSTLGRSFYAVGGNAEAARLSGLRQRRVVLAAFVTNGVFVGIASVLYATQLSVIQATPPVGFELLVITSAVVGGVSILGGTGTVVGATLAAVLLNVIRSAMVFINVSAFWLRAVQGLLILVTVLADLERRRRQRR